MRFQTSLPRRHHRWRTQYGQFAHNRVMRALLLLVVEDDAMMGMLLSEVFEEMDRDGNRGNPVAYCVSGR
jgi:hypothetical protein